MHAPGWRKGWARASPWLEKRLGQCMPLAAMPALGAGAWGPWTMDGAAGEAAGWGGREGSGRAHRNWLGAEEGS
eukprot:scaffold190525_cov21-Tisochrysis_lutea.AAC.1